MFIGATGTSGALPETTLKDQGYEGLLYQTHGSVMKPFIDALAGAGDGTMLPTGPMVVANDLPASNPVKAVSLDFIAKFDAKWGQGVGQPDFRLCLGRHAAAGCGSGAGVEDGKAGDAPSFAWRCAMRCRAGTTWSAPTGCIITRCRIITASMTGRGCWSSSRMAASHLVN